MSQPYPCDNSIDRFDNKIPVRHAISALIVAPATVSIHRRRYGARMTPGIGHACTLSRDQTRILWKRSRGEKKDS